MPIKPGTKGWQPKSIAARPTPPENQKGKVALQPDKFDNLVSQQGVKVRVYRTTFCPNVKSVDGAEHDISCPLCHGSGFVDRYPIETYAVIQSQELDTKHFAEGLFDGNSVKATFMQGVELQYFTLVELLDFTDLYFERVKRQLGLVDVLRYPGIRVNLLIDANGQEYFEGSDFRLNPSGDIMWLPESRQPERGVICSINYDTQVRFRAIKAGHVNRFAQVSVGNQTQMVKMNEFWTLQKSYLVERKDLDGHPIIPNRIGDADSPTSPEPATAEKL